MTTTTEERDRLARQFVNQLPEIIGQYDEAVASAQARYDRQVAELFTDLAGSLAPPDVPAPGPSEGDLGATLRAIAAEGEVERIREGVTDLLTEAAENDRTEEANRFLAQLRAVVFPPGRDQPTIVVDANSPEPPPYDPVEAHVLTAEDVANDVDRQITQPDPTYPAPRRVRDNPQA